jgi:hypothetical protein
MCFTFCLTHGFALLDTPNSLVLVMYMSSIFSFHFLSGGADREVYPTQRFIYHISALIMYFMLKLELVTPWKIRITTARIGQGEKPEDKSQVFKFYIVIFQPSA